ncbi:MAG: hypothetical protein ACRERD_06015 [Candidatus Binatia bacterium]
MLLSQHTLITAAWITLSLLPLLVAALIWFLCENWWGLLLVALYPLYFIPYGFFVSMPLMGWLFRKPASQHRKK